MKRYWKSATLLYLIHVTSSLSLSSSPFPSSRDGKSIQRPSEPIPPVDSATNPTRERRTGDLYTEVVIQQRKSKPKKRKRPNPAAPVVDSTLLRFLSTQKAESTKVQAAAATPSAESWLGQYNSNRVANLLIEHGVSEAAALQAGEVVQTHVLARTARRRVRDFLKKRDIEWINGGTASPQVVASSWPDYDLKDAVRLLLDFGFTGNDIAAILTHTPGIALMRPRRADGEDLTEETGGETIEETVGRAFDQLLLTKLKLRKYDARKVVRSCPGLLTLKGSKRAESVLTLMTSLGVSVSAIARERNSLPVLLSRAPSAIFRLVSFLASDAVRMKVKSIGPLLRRKECVELLDLVAPVPGVDPGRNATMTERISSEVWSANAGLRREQIDDVYRRMSKTAWTLRNEIGTADLGKVVAAYPGVLLLDAQEQILPTAAYLMNELGIYEDDLPQVLQLYPALLGRERNEMERTVTYLKDLGVEEDLLPSMFRAFPVLLTMDIEMTMQPVVDFLTEIGIANIGRVISRLPPVLGYSVDDELRPKWEYLSRVSLYPTFELSAFPAYFSYPLDRVVKTRYEYLQFVKKAPTQLLALDLVVRYGDKDFAERVAKDTDGGVAFSKFSKLRRAARSEQSARKRRA